MKQIAFLAGFLLLINSALAQQKRVNDLWTSLQNHPQADTFRVNRLNDLTGEWGLAFNQYDSLANQALLLARKLNYKVGQAKALFTLGITQYATNRNNPAEQEKVKQGMQQINEALLLAEQANEKRLLISMLTSTAASKRMSNAEKKQAIQYDKRALQLAEAIPDKKLMSDSERMIAMDFDLVEGNYAAALQWNMKALRTAQEANCAECQLYPLRAIGDNYTALKNYELALVNLNQALHISRTLTGESNNKFQFFILSIIGKLYHKLKRYPDAIQAYEQAFSIRKRDYPALTMAIFDNPISAIYQEQHRYPLAISLGVRGLKQARQDHNNWAEAELSTTLAKAYLATNRPDSARFYANQAFVIAQQTHQKELIRDAYELLAMLYSVQNQFDKAYQYQRLYYIYRDSLNNEDVTRKATAAQFTHQLDQQKSKIRLLTKEKQLQHFQQNAILVGVVLLLLLAGASTAFLLNRARLRRLEEAQALRKQIAQDLHDEVGSTLSSISLLSGHTNTLLSQNRPETAQKMVQKIYTDARQILESIDEIIWTINPGNDSLQRIILRLQEYAMPLMESKNIQFTFEADPALAVLSISMEVRRNLYLIGKEALNNLVKYSEATQAVVRFSYTNKQLTIAIEDNGRGFDPSQASVRAGQQNMKARAEAIGGLLSINSVPAQGTSLTFTTTLAE